MTELRVLELEREAARTVLTRHNQASSGELRKVILRVACVTEMTKKKNLDILEQGGDSVLNNNCI